MCTVTLLPIQRANGVGVRIGCNRDESLLRTAALHPRTKIFGLRSALLPVDPESNGTWVAVNDAGLAMVLLNRNRSAATVASAVAKRSRGTIIPSLLHCGSISEATDAVRSLRSVDFAPFRLLVVSLNQYLEFDSTQPTGPLPIRRIIKPLIFTSSSLGDEVVQGPRVKLFRQVFSGRMPVHALVTQQDLFHQHHWPGQEHLSVRMARQSARTVSYTVVQVFAEAARMIYRAFDEHEVSVSERALLV